MSGSLPGSNRGRTSLSTPQTGHRARMSARAYLQAMLIAMLALGVAVTGAVAASSGHTRDRRVLRTVQRHQDRHTEGRIDSLIRRMTLREKLDQLTLLSDGQMKEHPEEARKPIGA